MKRLIFACFVMTLFSAATVFAQNNGYTDDVYYNGSQAQQDAKAEAKKQKKQQKAQQGDAAYYNSSGTDNGNYNDGNAQVYNDSYGNSDDSYIDYDDDSYTSRIRRFYYPMYNTGYWGSVYSPFWYDPFYSNPYYGWGGWYTPGFSIGFGWGSGPYWNNCWGMNTWYGYGMFNSWYYPYGGYGYGGGWGYGGGYWNGYYAGMYDAGRYNNGYGRGAVNYGPRGSRNGLTTVGNYGRSAGLRSANSVTNTMAPMNGRNNNASAINRNTANASNDRGLQVDGQRAGYNNNNSRNNNINRNDAIRLDNANNRAVEIDQNATGRQAQQQAPERRGGFFNNVFRGNDNNSNSRSVERSQPSRAQQRESAPVRSYSPSPAPSRSYSPSPSSAPARSYGGGGGGGSRSVGGRR